MANAAGIGSGIGTGAGMAIGGPVGASIGSSIGGIAGSLLGGTDHSAEDRMKAIQEMYRQIQNPNFDFSSLTPEQKAVVGQLAPEAMQALEMQGPQTVQDNGQGRAAQLAVLQKLQAMGAGGVNLQDKADLMSIQNAQGADNKGQQDAIIADQRARGMGGAGSEMAARMIAEQGAADRAATQGTQVLSQAQQRALQALVASGDAGSNLRNQDNNLAANNANIINAFNQANFANKQGISNQNVANRNAAQGFNLNNAQSTSNSNVDNNNAFKQYNQSNQNNLKQQQFGNDIAKVNGQAGAATQVANYMNNSAAAGQQRSQGIGQALGSLAGSGIASLSSTPPTPDVMAGAEKTDRYKNLFQS